MITLNGANVGCSVPSDTHLIIIRARGGDVYYAVNGAAGAGSPGYVPDGSIELVGFGSISNLSMLSVYGAAGAFAHIQYYDEA